MRWSPGRRGAPESLRRPTTRVGGRQRARARRRASDVESRDGKHLGCSRAPSPSRAGVLDGPLWRSVFGLCLPATPEASREKLRDGAIAFQAFVPQGSDKRCSGKKGWGEVPAGERSLTGRPNVPDGKLRPWPFDTWLGSGALWLARGRARRLTHLARRATAADATERSRRSARIEVRLGRLEGCARGSSRLQKPSGSARFSVSRGEEPRELRRGSSSTGPSGVPTPIGVRFERKSAVWRKPAVRNGASPMTKRGSFGCRAP